jgi:hypothetical protein
MNVLDSANVAPALADMIETYLLNQGRQTMAYCTQQSSFYWHLAISVNNLEWDCFVERHLPFSLIDIIRPMFHCYKPHGSLDLWGIRLIKVKGLIGLAPKQWLYRNNSVHYVSDELTLKHHEKLTAKIKILLKTRRCGLLHCH